MNETAHEYVLPERLESLGVCLVTGGSGFLGRSLCRTLVERGVRVRALDLRRHDGLPPSVEMIQGDLRDPAILQRACEGVQTIFHTAVVLNTFTHLRPSVREHVLSVNVGGTKKILEVARSAGVKRFVYTSSVNVVFDRRIHNGTEDEPYADSATDIYTVSKRESERAVLGANDATFSTCALRPGGIYGPGETHHMPRFVEALRAGKFVMTVGDRSAKADNSYIDDLVSSHIAAAIALAPGSANAGKAYFVTDGDAINQFEFFRPLVEGLGYRFPSLYLPAWIARASAFLGEWLHVLGGPAPFMTRMETRKVVDDHYFRPDRAERDFGWRPNVKAAEGVRRVFAYAKQLHDAIPVVDRPALYWWVSILLGMTATYVLTFNDAAYGWFVEHVTGLITRPVLYVIAALATALHVGEALYAFSIARRHGLSTATGWLWQTLLLGYPSLRLLLKQVETRIAPGRAEELGQR